MFAGILVNIYQMHTCNEMMNISVDDYISYNIMEFYMPLILSVVLRCEILFVNVVVTAGCNNGMTIQLKGTVGNYVCMRV